ncbi:MAG: VWA domain-containing protein [Dehalococcoidia bacterium]
MHSMIFLTMAALFGGVLFAMPSSGRAQEPPPTLQIHQVDGLAYPRIRAVVSALDADGAPIPGLSAASFQPFEGETPITLTGVTAASDPSQRLGVALVIDVSASMRGAPLDAAKLASIAFVQGFGPADEAAVFAFNDNVKTVVPFTLDRDALVAGIAGLEASGGSALHQAAQAGSFAAGATTTERKAIVLLAASGSTSPDVTAGAALGVAQTVAAPVFTVALGPASDGTFLEGLAAVTMGQHRVAEASGAAGALSDIASVLRGQYVLTMTGSGTAAANGRAGELRLIADIDGTPAGAVAGFRRGLDPAEAFGHPDDDTATTEFARTALFALLALIGAGIIAGAAYWAIATLRQMRVEHHQREWVAPNQQRAAAQPLPRPAGPLRTAAVMSGPPTLAPSMGPSAAPEPASVPEPAPMPERMSVPAPTIVVSATVPVEVASASRTRAGGRFVERTPRGRGETYELGAGPIVIGSSPRESTIVLPASVDVAPAHVRIWLRDGKYVMHHAGGFRRRTLVGGQPTDWCVLEHGDEVQIGPHKLVYVEEGNERPLRF